MSAQESADKIYRTTEVDQKPDLIDGMYKLTLYISENYKFPPVKNKKVRIFTSFIVEPDGRMNDVKAFYISVKDLVPAANVQIQTEEEKAADALAYEQMKNEAARVVASFGKTWVPAKISGKPVRCLYNYPISFNIE